MRSFAISLMLSFFFVSCESNSPEAEKSATADVKYVLPYPVGKGYTCTQGFNTSFSHYGTFCYSVDFSMPAGTLITAARSGRVVYILENYSDDDHTVGHENVVIVMHEDSTCARYGHLTNGGALVEIFQLLMPGDIVGLSGNSGNSISPHLHFDVTGSCAGRGDQTIPFDFKNTSPHPFGFERGAVYKAFPY